MPVEPGGERLRSARGPCFPRRSHKTRLADITDLAAFRAEPVETFHTSKRFSSGFASFDGRAYLGISVASFINKHWTGKRALKLAELSKQSAPRKNCRRDSCLWQVEGGNVMKVKEIMSPDAKACAETANLARAAELMSHNNCGILPVVAGGGKVVGLITDRDICVSAAKVDKSLASIYVNEVISGEVHACRPEDDIHAALRTMRENKVRRLPVIDAEGILSGILSMDDVLLSAEEVTGRTATELSYGDAVRTYKAILAQQTHRVAA